MVGCIKPSIELYLLLAFHCALCFDSYEARITPCRSAILLSYCTDGLYLPRHSFHRLGLRYIRLRRASCPICLVHVQSHTVSLLPPQTLLSSAKVDSLLKVQLCDMLPEALKAFWLKFFKSQDAAWTLFYRTLVKHISIVLEVEKIIMLRLSGTPAASRYGIYNSPSYTL